MRQYHFAICEVGRRDLMLLNPDGVRLEDDEAALFYATRLVRSLRKEHPVKYLGQVLLVKDGDREACAIPIGLARSRQSPTHPRRL